jgi:uncharacterized metal-binding protein YceD (DUF177 family)
MSDAAEFSRLVALVRIGAEPYRQHIAAGEAERDALARRFDLVSLDRLEADIELVREASGTILLSADFTAAFAQECIVTLDPVPGAVGEQFQLRYGPPEAEEIVPSGDDDPAFEPLNGDTIDIGEAVAQEFSLALPSFPRVPNAVVEPASSGDAGDGPFAVLAKFHGDEPQ